MKIVLRLISLALAVSVAGTVWAIWFFWPRLFESLAHGDAGGVFGLWTILSWLLQLTLGSFAAVELWRLRERGRIAAIVIYMNAILYNTLGAQSIGHLQQPLGWLYLLKASWRVVLVIILFLPAAHRVCRHSAPA